MNPFAAYLLGVLTSLAACGIAWFWLRRRRARAHSIEALADARKRKAP